MQLKRKITKKDEISESEDSEKDLEIPELEDGESWSSDLDSEMPEFESADDFFDVDIDESDLEDIEGWEIMDTELEAEYEDYLAKSYEPEIYETEETNSPGVLEDEENLEIESNDFEESEVNQEMNLRDRLKKINEENDAVLRNIDKVLLETAKAQNCTSCVITIDKIITKDDYIYSYMENNGLDIINLDTNEGKSKVTVSWE